MLQFQINTPKEFVGTVKEGHAVIISTRNNDSVVPKIDGFSCIITEEEFGSRIVLIMKDSNEENFSHYEFDKMALTGTIPEGTSCLIIPDEQQLYDFASQLLENNNSESVYIFAVYNPLI